MSPLLRERIVIGFAPERLTALWLGGLIRMRLLDRHAMVLQDADPIRWDGGINALETLLSEPSWRGRQIDVVLSGHYVHHIIVPPGRGLAESELLALAKSIFQDTFGELGSDWEIRVSPPGSGVPTVASGVPRGLLAALRGVCEGRGRLRSIQPVLMPAFRRARQEIRGSAGCLAIVEPGRITIAAVDSGQWKYIDSRAGDGSILPQFLLESGLLHGRQPGGLLWLSDLTGNAHLPAGTFWSHKPIEPPRMPGIDPGTSLAGWGLA